MSKRKLDEFLQEIEGDAKPPTIKPAFQNSLDSDEEDYEEKEEKYNVMNPDEFEGVEDGPVTAETNTGFTAFNMKEEEEEGHFDAEGHYHWKKEKEIRDNWIDNIDWAKIKPKTDVEKKKEDEDDSDEESDFMYDPIPSYKKMLEFLKPGETVSKALCRLGKGKKKLTTAERWKRKKDPNTAKEEDENSLSITKLTEIANDLLTRTGNMDIYQESYEQIQKKIRLADKHSHPSKVEAEFDMFSDDFDSKEQKKTVDISSTNEAATQESSNADDKDDLASGEIFWEFKWSQDESAQVYGPHTSEQMQTWAKEGYFKKGAWVRKKGQKGDFYNVARIDFELYI